MSRTKLYARIGIGVGTVALLACVFFVAAAIGDLGRLRQGIEKGFDLRGAYQLPESRGEYLSFQVFDEERTWGAWSGGDATAVRGTIGATNDPNCYLLLDEDGVEVGWVHLAFADRDGAGTLYVRYGDDGHVEMRKVSTVPLYFK